jgi:hypothetical protein
MDTAGHQLLSSNEVKQPKDHRCFMEILHKPTYYENEIRVNNQ